MSPLPGHVETDRLLLRPWTVEDVDALAAVFADERVWRFPLGRGRTPAETAAFVERQRAAWTAGQPALWAAQLRSTNELIGYLGLSVPTFLPELLPAVEVGWRLHPRHWGQGLATEGGRAALREAFSGLEYEQVVSIGEPANHRSVAVMQRLGMRLWYRTTHPERGVPLVVYRLRREDWPADTAPAAR